MTNSDNFETDTDTEQLDEFDTPDVAEDGTAPAPVKKSGGGAGKIIALLLVLGIGGAAGAAKMGFVHLPVNIPGITPAAKPPQPQAAATTAPTGTEMPAATPAVPGMTPVTGAEAQPPAAAPAWNSPVVATPEAVPAADAAKAGESKVNPTALMPEAIGAAPSGAPGIAAPDALASQPAGISNPTIAAPEATPVDPLSITPAPAATAAPTTPVSADPLAATAPAPDALPTATATPPVTPAVVAAPDAETAAKLSAAEVKNADLEKQLANAKAELAKKEADLAAAKAKHPKAAPDDMAVSTPATAEQTSAVRTTTRSIRHTRHTTGTGAAYKSAGSRWVLKSAKPGMAWVAMPGSSEIKAVAVGDNLPGVGRVTAVGKDSAGRWVVSGTRGSVNQ